MPTPPRPDHIWPLAFVALALTVVLVAAGGRLEARTGDDTTRVSWAGLAGAPRPRDRDRAADDRRPAHAVARRSRGRGRRAGRRRRPAPLDCAGQGGRAARAVQARRAGAPGHARLHLRAGGRGVFRGARPARDRDPRTAARGAGRLPGSFGLPRVRLVVAAPRARLPARQRPPPRRRAPGLRRSRCHRGAARHRRRPCAAVPAREDQGRRRHRRRERPRARRAASRERVGARAPRDRARRDRRGGERSGRASRASRLARGSCRFASPAGSVQLPGATPCTRAPTRSSRASSAPSIPTATGSRTTLRASRWSASRSRTRRSRTGRSRKRSRVRFASTRS